MKLVLTLSFGIVAYWLVGRFIFEGLDKHLDGSGMAVAMWAWLAGLAAVIVTIVLIYK